MNHCWSCARFKPMETRDEDGDVFDEDMGVCRFNHCITVGNAIECPGWTDPREVA